MRDENRIMIQRLLDQRARAQAERTRDPHRRRPNDPHEILVEELAVAVAMLLAGDEARGVFEAAYPDPVRYDEHRRPIPYRHDD